MLLPPRARIDDTVQMTGHARPTEFSDDLLERINSVIAVGDEIETLSIKRPNWIAGTDRSGIWVETETSRRKGTGPQLVPAWMIVVAWEHLRRNRTLSQVELLNDLNVKRSAFVCALIAQFPDVVVEQNRPTVLQWIATP